jgi:hypothetical protein
MKLLTLAVSTAIVGLVAGVADAQGRSDINCISYQGPNSGQVVHGTICRTGGAGAWQEINNSNANPIRWQETAESPGQVTLFDASRSYTLIIDANAHQILVKRNPTDNFHFLYSISSVQ